jgi:hypothetical protein
VNKFLKRAAVVPLFAFGAAAQDDQGLAAVKKRLDEAETKLRVATVGAIRGPVVKGMPYSAEEVTETNQVLGDGTRIHREVKTTVYRDSEGRTRRETPDSITINDPVAGATYVINPKTNQVKALKMAQASYIRRDNIATGGAVGVGAGVPGTKSTFEMRVDGDGPPNIVIDGKSLDPKDVEKMIAKAKAEGEAGTQDFVFAAPLEGHFSVATAAAPAMRRVAGPNSESLGKKNIEGVIAEGTRSTQTIAVGEIGNDRPIQIVNEHWYSEELGMTVMTRRSDPRMGEETFRLMNIRRGDPASYLFQPPAGAQVQERKM